MKKILLFVPIILFLASCSSTSPKKAKEQGESKVLLQRFLSKSRFLDNGSSVRVFLSIDIDRTFTLAEASKDFVIAYNLYPDYNAKQNSLSQGNVSINSENASQEGGLLTVWFDIPKPKDLLTGLALTEIKDLRTGNKIFNDCFLRFQSGKVGDYFMFYDKTGKTPLARNYFTVQDTVVLKSLSDKQQTFKVFKYRYDFEAAISPMSTTPRAASKSLFVDSSFTVTSNKPFVLKSDALYYFTRDTTESYGIGMVVADKRFPKMTRPEKLVRPLIYVSTNAETSDLYNSKDPKRSLDNYWLNIMQGNQGTAKRTIKSYYQRVEQANRLFTTYKEGWKTDKGMVYIVMGDPTRITRTKDKEVWTYTRNSQYSEVNFTFTRRANQFADDHYELQRYAEYQSIWFPTVEQWRNGDKI
ncbi:GWxTD domain-containing protein [Arcicella lustrica]|uniref:GWxTD domain-containing protein n=1 Tax=Arcicella lustrica TaxID=2984196 RepID=A0ABU5SNZ9_9BACT|nr:GWxTD domain-containing protein [Arcicella sp. DC25W]MEA5428969.1 GWxTD domain-containing protein [Arcicella sp. DC25W]